jgi:hypothetical protein
MQVCDKTEVNTAYLPPNNSTVTVTNTRRASGSFTGKFVLLIRLSCSPLGYPVGNFSITNLSMNDSAVEGTISSTTVDELTSAGGSTPTAYVSGRCKVTNDLSQAQAVATTLSGCRYWLMVVDNTKAGVENSTPDVVSFLALNGLGQRIAYGTGLVSEGDIVVQAGA